MRKRGDHSSPESLPCYPVYRRRRRVESLYAQLRNAARHRRLDPERGLLLLCWHHIEECCSTATASFVDAPAQSLEPVVNGLGRSSESSAGPGSIVEVLHAEAIRRASATGVCSSKALPISSKCPSRSGNSQCLLPEARQSATGRLPLSDAALTSYCKCIAGSSCASRYNPWHNLTPNVCASIHSVSTAVLASVRKARLTRRAAEKKPGPKARFFGARRARSSGCHALDHDQPGGRCLLPQ